MEASDKPTPQCLIEGIAIHKVVLTLVGQPSYEIHYYLTDRLGRNYGRGVYQALATEEFEKAKLEFLRVAMEQLYPQFFSQGKATEDATDVVQEPLIPVTKGAVPLTEKSLLERELAGENITSEREVDDENNH